MKSGILYSAIGILAAFGAACSNEPGKETANSAPIIKSEPAKPASDKGDAVVTGGDLAFMNDAAPGGMAEVELGNMAASKAQNAEVKAFGQKMVEDHTKAGEELKQLAAQKKVMLPPDVLPAHKQLMEKLSKLSGADFDKEYVAAMVEAHEKDVAAFENVSKTAADADVKAFATKTLPTLKMHLEMIKTMAGKMGVKMKT
jgi:putative membrane protein